MARPAEAGEDAASAALRSKLAAARGEVERLRWELDVVKASVKAEIRGPARQEPTAREVRRRVCSRLTLGVHPCVRASVCGHTQLEGVELAARLQGRLDESGREAAALRAQVSELTAAVSAGRAMTATLERVVEDRTQELVIARGELDSLHALVLRLQETVKEQAGPLDRTRPHATLLCVSVRVCAPV